MIKIIIGLGNPGARYYYTRHNIGFRVVDHLADGYQGHWRMHANREAACISPFGHDIMLIKPQTFMNASGAVLGSLGRHIRPAEILVVHDELELPFGKVTFKTGGSARGHMGSSRS